MAIDLRAWQMKAISAALEKFRAGQQHFLCLATPGAGKTLMAAIVASHLHESGEIDLVFCISPSVNVSNSFRQCLEEQLGHSLDGRVGSKGAAFTYHAMLNLSDEFWARLAKYRVLVIFDEIHHCAGDNLENGNSWGQTIIQKIQGRASYTLALTGTPWRSDRVPVALASYCRDGKVVCDYTYGLADAVRDGVCRVPHMTAFDSGNISVRNGPLTENFQSLEELLQKSKSNYRQVVDNHDLIAHLLRVSDERLDGLRREHPDAGALVVAGSVEHAIKIAEILHNETGRSAQIATYVHADAQDTIKSFKSGQDRWIISVGMISEGTDIPRLRVCCHLTTIKTELHFRQVLGRILRSNGQPNHTAYFYMPADPMLIDFANRVLEDIPEAATITVDSLPSVDQTQTSQTSTPMDSAQDRHQEISITILRSAQKPATEIYTAAKLAGTYDRSVSFFGRFKERVIHLKDVKKAC